MTLPPNIVDLNGRFLSLTTTTDEDGIIASIYDIVEGAPKLRYTDVNSTILAVTTDGQLYDLTARMLCTIPVQYQHLKFERVIEMPSKSILAITECKLIMEINDYSDPNNLIMSDRNGSFKNEVMTIHHIISIDRIRDHMYDDIKKIRTGLVFTDESIFSIRGVYWATSPICTRGDIIDMTTYQYTVSGRPPLHGAVALMKDGIIRCDLNTGGANIQPLSRWESEFGVHVIENPEEWRFLELGKYRALANARSGEVRLMCGLDKIEVLNFMTFDSFRLEYGNTKSARNVAEGKQSSIVSES